MWLRRTKSRVNKIHPPPKFTCTSFKDIQSLLSDDQSPASTSSPSSICHRNSLLRTLSHPHSRSDPEPDIRIQGADQTVVVYFTSLRVIRSTYEDCKSVISILRAFRVSIDERDLSMDSRFMDELRRILVKYEKSTKLTLPRVFIGGRYVGGAEEVRRMHESGELKGYLEGIPKTNGTCETCGGYRFLLCIECNGSHKCYNEKGGFKTCVECNENGLIRDEILSQYSSMSEDSDDARYYESSNCPSQPKSIPTSPASPYRCQKPLTSSYPSHSSIVSSSMPRQRGSHTEARFPPSPSDICHSADLRRAALLRSVQMRAQPSGLLGQELTSNMEAEERPCSYVKAVDNNETEYKIADCSQTSIAEHQDTEKSSENISNDHETG